MDVAPHTVKSWVESDPGNENKPNERSKQIAGLELDADAYVLSAIDIVDELSKLKPSRDLSMVRTKLDEAQMWLYRIEREAR